MTSENNRIESARNVFEFISNTSMDQIKNGGSIDGSLFAILYEKGSDEINIFPVPLSDTFDAEERMQVMEAVGEMLGEKDSDVYMFMTVSEAWGSKAKKSDGKFVRPSEDPKRFELFIASGRDKNGYIRNVSFEIKRKPDGVVFSSINIFGKSQSKFLHGWHSDKEESKLKIENTLVSTVWDSYINKKKSLRNEKK